MVILLSGFFVQKNNEALAPQPHKGVVVETLI